MGSPPKTGRVHPVEPITSLSQGLSVLITRDVQWSISDSDFGKLAHQPLTEQPGVIPPGARASRGKPLHEREGRSHPPGSAGVPPAPSSCKQDASYRLRLGEGGRGASALFPLDRWQNRPAWLGQAPGRAGRPRSRGAPMLTGCIAYASSVLMADSMLVSGLATSKGRQSRVTSSRSRYRSALVNACVWG